MAHVTMFIRSDCDAPGVAVYAIEGHAPKVAVSLCFGSEEVAIHCRSIADAVALYGRLGIALQAHEEAVRAHGGPIDLSPAPDARTTPTSMYGGG